MDWMFSNGGAPSYVLIPLGTHYKRHYYTNDQCSTNLEELVTQLQSDDPTNHSRRLGLGFVDIINKDLKPMLICCYKEEPAIFRSAVKLLVCITTPIRCLTFIETSSQRIHASDIIFELRQLLYRAKESFLDARSTRAIIAHIESLLELEHQPLTPENTVSVNLCLALLRNVLHIPERPSVRLPQMLLSSPQSGADNTLDDCQQNQIMCNLLAQGLGQLLLNLLACPQREEWVGTITQVIAVLFKGRSSETFRDRLSTDRTVMDSVTSESFEEDDDDDTCSVLSENISGFSYNTLVGTLHDQLLQHDLPIDEAQFFWLITYFGGFAPLLKLDITHIKDVMNIEILSYLTWGVIHETEILDKNYFREVNLESSVRRLHRGVTAIRQFLQVMEMYSKGVCWTSQQVESDDSQGCETYIRQLHSFLPVMKDLHQAFLLLLRQYNPKVQDGHYLRDVIATNHFLLVTLERAAGVPAYGGSSVDLKEHLKQFCTPTIVARYGIALGDFRTNDIVFLHHVNGDLGRIDLLLNSIIVHPFVKICEEQFKVCETWHGMIQCVVQTFIRDQLSRGHQRTGATSRLSESDQVNPSSSAEPHHVASNPYPVFRQPRTNIETLLVQLKNSGFQRQLDWIQYSLLTTCSAQLGTYDGQNFCNPIACLSHRKKISCPIVPWTENEASALRSEIFVCLLQQLGLLPSIFRDPGFYPCIPYNWSPITVFRKALVFSPIEQTMVDFDLSLVINRTDKSNPCPP
ncbi:putative TIMELESS/TIM-1 protein [Daphnia pulex]|uniref:Putative TIMELESS/TIM-1 protein n=1 Tax=Daphnia pulex TaxID=6669 RepID=E9GI55_DAPPU|nr:putative TIMELESS/TIM-1 protein [Daphnia pulex]|eukprot:EFX80828.1 putative TIMELESS/TIM-1 protein [Daphnia pulex]